MGGGGLTGRRHFLHGIDIAVNPCLLFIQNWTSDYFLYYVIVLKY
jgi:hypothetical protein